MSTVQIKVAGADWTDDAIFATASFESAVNGVGGKAKVRFRDLDRTKTVTPGAVLELIIDGDPVWYGFALIPKYVYAFAALNVTDFGPPRFIEVEGVDINVLFTKRIVFDQSTPENVISPLYPANTPDTDAITDLLADWLDLSGDGLDTSSGVVGVGDINEDQKARPWSGSDTWGQAMQSIAMLPAAIFYLRPNKELAYVDTDTPDAPFGLSDQPNGTTFKGYREMEILLDGTNLANDVMCWGIGYGSSTPVFKRIISSGSVATHGLWQLGQVTYGIYKQATIDRVADSIINGSPEHRRGAKFDRTAVMVTTYEPGLLPAQKVDFRSEVFGWQDVIPIRKMEVTFEAPDAPKYRLTLSHEIDTPWSFFDPWRFKFPGFGFPTFSLPPFPTQPGPPTEVCTPPPTSFVIGGGNSKIAISADGVTWSLVRTGGVSADAWRGIVWAVELGIFVAVGGTATNLATSPDGTTWTAGSFGLTPAFVTADAIAWAPSLGLFVAVGGGGTSTLAIATSPDAVTWTYRTPVFTGSFRQVACIAWAPALGLFAAGGDSGQMMTSTDGINWTLRTSPWGSGVTIQAIAWAPALARFVIGSSSGIAYSADGISWTLAASGQTSVGALTWSPDLSLFVAGRGGFFTDHIATSPDGSAWTLRTSPFATSSSVLAVAWSSSAALFIAAGSSGGVAMLATSPDGVNWTSRTSGFGSSSINSALGPEEVCVLVPGSQLYGPVCESATRLDSTHYQLSRQILPNSSRVMVGSPGLLYILGTDYTEDTPDSGTLEFAAAVDAADPVYVCYTADGLL